MNRDARANHAAGAQPESTLHWLLRSDPAIRWQVLSDLIDAPAREVAQERARVSQEGLGKNILDMQQPDGTWRRDGVPAWLSTLSTMQLLRATGVDPATPSVADAMDRLASGVRWNTLGGCWELRGPETGGNTFFDGEEEPCINGNALAAGSYLGRPSEKLVQHLLQGQLEDGGWNCEAPKSRRSSFHSTICVLEGLFEYERAAGSAPDVSASRKRGEEYLLERGLFRRLSTGELANSEFLNLSFPPRYHYDVLRALEYFRVTGSRPDARLGDAVDIVRMKRQADGRWLLDAKYDEGLAVVLDETAGEPSRWNTLRALRVCAWQAQPR